MTTKLHSSANEEIFEEKLQKAVIRLNGNVLGLVLGILAGLVIFAATNFLVIKGGETVGPHLALLGNFFIGYSVTFVGSLVGFLYGFLTGYIVGFLIGWIYNSVVYLKTYFKR
jgi:tetrahydromethanopterin S-methyltransferase subunit G